MAIRKKPWMGLNVRDLLKNKCLVAGLGIVLVIAGVTLILVWWSSVTALFQGLIALGLALAGLVMLYSLSK